MVNGILKRRYTGGPQRETSESEGSEAFFSGPNQRTLTPQTPSRVTMYKFYTSYSYSFVQLGGDRESQSARLLGRAYPFLQHINDYKHMQLCMYIMCILYIYIYIYIYIGTHTYIHTYIIHVCTSCTSTHHTHTYIYIYIQRYIYIDRYM